jgi:hypothetical protein
MVIQSHEYILGTNRSTLYIHTHFVIRTEPILLLERIKNIAHDGLVSCVVCTCHRVET